MSTHYKPYSSGGIFGTRYTFDTEKDGLRKHTHDTTTAHNVIVLRGQVQVRFADHVHHLHVGDVYDFDWAQEHQIVCMEPGSEILNLYLNGQPIEYKSLREEDFYGEFTMEPL